MSTKAGKQTKKLAKHKKLGHLFCIYLYICYFVLFFVVVVVVGGGNDC